MMIEERIAALILAAGRSSRMGELKALMPLGRQTVLEKLIGSYREAGISDLLVVLGHRASEIRPLVEKHGASWVINEQYDQGMFSSVQSGVKNLNRGCGAFFLQPVDIPLVVPETLKHLIAVHRQKQAAICYPCCDGRRGHPPLISATLIPAILAFDEPGGMRALLARYEQDALPVDCGDPGILMNLNTPADYERMASRLAQAKNL